MKASDALSVIALSVLLIGSAGHASRQHDLPGIERTSAFDLSVRQVFDGENKPVLVVTTSIPYSRLVFFLRDDRYVASYRIFMELKPKKGTGMRGEVWEEVVTADRYENTHARGVFSTSKRSFGVEPGKYSVKLSIEVVDTSLRFQREKSIRIVGHGQKTLVVSEPAFIVPGRQEPEDRPSPGEIRIFVSGAEVDESAPFSRSATYQGNDVWSRIACSIVGPFADGGLAIAVRVTDFEGKVVLYNHRMLEGTKGGHLLLYCDMIVDGLPLGAYTWEVAVSLQGSETWAHAEGHFSVLFTRSSFFGNFDQTLAILKIIAQGKELDELKNAPPDERYAAWQRFWLKRDAAPSSDSYVRLDEFYRRLGYVMRNLSAYRPGWQTDRGVVYIQLGEPDRIATMTTGFGRNYLYWYYYSFGTVYIFQDHYGTGDYQLVSTELL